MKTMMGSEPALDWAGLAPHIEHETREAIVEALRWLGPLSVRELKGAIGPDVPLACIAYHVSVLVGAGQLGLDGERVGGASVEALYYFPAGS